MTADLRIRSLLDRLSTLRGDTGLGTPSIVTLVVGHASLFEVPPRLLALALYDAANGLRSILSIDVDRKGFASHPMRLDLVDPLRGRTAYEMKDRPVTQGDIDLAVRKAAEAPTLPDAYLFVTTAPIDPDVADYARRRYRDTGGMEMAILSVAAYVRHVLHFLHRHRGTFLDAYQRRMLAEPDSAVRRSVKEAFLAMRHAAEDAAE